MSFGVETVSFNLNKFTQIYNEFMDSEVFHEMISNLVRIAEIIAIKLKRTKVTPEIEEESKRTQRNSQYQVTSSLIIYHLIYRITYDSSPPAITEPKHPLTRNNYTKEMCTNLDKYMKILVKLVFEGFVAQLRKIYGERIDKNKGDTVDVKRESDANNSDALEEDDDDYAPGGSYVGSGNALPTLSSTTSKNDSTTSAIYKKLYLSLLMELSQLRMIEFIKEKIESKRYPERAIMEILKETARRLAKITVSEIERRNWLYSIDHKLKNALYKEVVNILLEKITDVVYRRFRIDTITDSREDCAPIDFKQFQALARFTNSVYSYTTTKPIQLTMETFTAADGTVYDFLKFNREGSTDIFDIKAKNKIQLDGKSWKERLDMMPEDHVPQSICKIIPYPYKMIEFDTDNTYLYIKTAGFGIGTFFVKIGKQVEKRNKMQMLTKRHKKMNMNQLYDGEVLTKVPKIDPCNVIVNPIDKIKITSTVKGNITFAPSLYDNLTNFETMSEV